MIYKRIFRAFPQPPPFLLIILETLFTMFPMMVTISHLKACASARLLIIIIIITKVAISLISHLEGLVRLVSPRPRPERPTRLIPAALVAPLCKRECVCLFLFHCLCVFACLYVIP